MAERVEFQFGGLSNTQHESKVPLERCWRMSNADIRKGIVQGIHRTTLVGQRASYNSADVGYGLGYGEFNSSEIQRLTMTPTTTGGTFRLSFESQVTGTIAWNASASDVRTALATLPNLTARDVRTSGGPFPIAPVEVEFVGVRSGTDVAMLVLHTNSLTGPGTPTVAIQEIVKGGPTRTLLSFVKHNNQSNVSVYTVDPVSGAHTITTSNSLHASQWYCEQYGSRIFAINEIGGLQYQRIGGLWNDGQIHGPASGVPNPAFAPSAEIVSPDVPPIDFSPAGLNATPTFIGPSGNTFSTTITEREVSVTRTAGTYPGTTTCELRLDFSAQDWSESDIFFVEATTPNHNNPPRHLRMGLYLRRSGPVVLNLLNGHQPWSEQWNQVNPSSNRRRIFAWAITEAQRNLRTNIVTVGISFPTPGWPVNETWTFTVWRYNTHIHSGRPVADPSSLTTLVPGPTEYSYSYWDALENKESGIAPITRFGANPWALTGYRYQLTAPGSPAMTAADRVYFYRKEVSTGLWRRLPNSTVTAFGAANNPSGNVTFTDFWTEPEISAFPGISATPTGFLGVAIARGGSAITSWKQSLVVGAERQAWISFIGRPNLFAPSRDDEAGTRNFQAVYAEDETRGRTVYLSDNRSEEIWGAHGQDTLYLIGQSSVYAMVGDTPSQASPPRRLPGSKGSVGRRAHQKYAGGVLVGAPNTLYFYAVGRGFSGEDNGALVSRDECLEVETSWRDLIATNPDRLVIVEHDDDIWCFCENRYMLFSQQKWHEGVLPFSVNAALSIRNVGIFMQAFDGRIYKFSPGQYDNTQSWSYETGLLDGPRTHVKGIHVKSKGNPTIKIRVYEKRGVNTDQYGQYNDFTFNPDGDVWVRPLVIPPSSRIKVFLSGKCGDDDVQSLAFIVGQSPTAYRE